LHFIDFNTEPTNDKIRVIDNAANPSVVLATLSGSTIPADVTCPSGDMLVWFTSNSSIASSGWTACYTIALSVENFSLIKELSVYPNPSDNNLHVSFSSSGGKSAILQLLNITGQLVYSENISAVILFSLKILMYQCYQRESII